MARGINELPSGWMIKPLSGRSLVPATPAYASNIPALPSPGSNRVPDRARVGGGVMGAAGRFESSPPWASTRKSPRGPSRGSR
jgi:hypothetical protein